MIFRKSTETLNSHYYYVLGRMCEAGQAYLLNWSLCTILVSLHSPGLYLTQLVSLYPTGRFIRCWCRSTLLSYLYSTGNVLLGSYWTLFTGYQMH